MNRSAEIVVIGGGVIGASVAYHLAAGGVRDVVVLDAAPQAGAGSTGRATGGFRVQFATAVDVRLSLLARAKLRRFAEETGGDCGYDPAGYLWLASDDAELAVLRAALAVQRANGVDDAVEVDPDTIARLNPALRRDGVAGGTYCASDGFIRPLGILDGYRRAAERAGVRFVFGRERHRLRLRARRAHHRGAHRARRDYNGRGRERRRCLGGAASRGSPAPSCPSRRCAAKSPSPFRRTRCPRRCR